MLKDERDVVQVLKGELEYLTSGAYAEAESWRPRLIFEDSPTCLNFGHRDNPSPCSGCVLIDFVPPEHRSEDHPCRHIPLDASGQTLDDLYHHSDQEEVEGVVCNWLRSTTERLERERELRSQEEERTALDSRWWRSARCSQEGKGIALYERFHPKCANPACPAAFHWLAGGTFFRFRPSEASSAEEPRVPSTEHPRIKHYWLCERCTRLYTLTHGQEEGVILRPRWVQLPTASASEEEQ